LYFPKKCGTCCNFASNAHLIHAVYNRSKYSTSAIAYGGRFEGITSV